MTEEWHPPADRRNWLPPPTDYQEAHRWKNGKPQRNGNGHDKGADDETLPFTPFAEIKPGLDANDFVEGLLASSSLVVVYGAPGSGKTFWVLDLCLHVAAGRLWRGRAVERGAVILLALEGGSGVRNRIAAARARMHLPYTTPLVLVQCPVDRCRAEADVAKVVATVRLIAARLDVPVRMLVVDTLAGALAGGNENAPEDMGASWRTVI